MLEYHSGGFTLPDWWIFTECKNAGWGTNSLSESVFLACTELAGICI